MTYKDFSAKYPYYTEELEYQAAKLEYMAGYSREEAEQIAMARIRKKHLEKLVIGKDDSLQSDGGVV